MQIKIAKIIATMFLTVYGSVSFAETISCPSGSVIESSFKLHNPRPENISPWFDADIDVDGHRAMGVAHLDYDPTGKQKPYYVKLSSTASSATVCHDNYKHANLTCIYKVEGASPAVVASDVFAQPCSAPGLYDGTFHLLIGLIRTNCTLVPGTKSFSCQPV